MDLKETSTAMYAIFRTAGKQFRAEPGRKIHIPSLTAEPGAKLTFEEVLLGSDGKTVRAGTPVLKGASVTAEVVRHGKDKKVIVFKMKRRKNYAKKQGHRQGFTEIRIDSVDLG
ncbi:MAG TPA: 50S ribosomal protein L21 [Gemmatimonadales bacterium]|nr:50S ribosomal protein L21 [Gemmatimonadales bacterium]